MSHPPIDNHLLRHNQQSLIELKTGLQREAGTFSLTIAACNYSLLRNVLLDHLSQGDRAQVLRLPAHITSLFAAIQAHLHTATPPALMIVGFELFSAPELKALFQAANLARDEFRKQFALPLVLWMTEPVRQQFARDAPDFRSFSPSAITFTVPKIVLEHALRMGAEQVFYTVLEQGGDRDQTPGALHLRVCPSLRGELDFALQELARQGWVPDADLAASIAFLQGRAAHSRLEMEAAKAHYERSLHHWQTHTAPYVLPEWVKDMAATPLLTAIEKQAALLMHLGLWWRSNAVLQRSAYQASLRQARRYFEQCLEIFREEEQRQRLANFLHMLAEVLQKQQDWDALETLAVEGISLHQETRDRIRLARDHGFLAEVALVKADWLTAKGEAQLALKLLQSVAAQLAETPEDVPLAQALAIAQQFQQGWYQFLLGEAEMHLGQTEAAIAHLESARHATNPDVDLTLHRHVLRHLIDHYFNQGRYADAFEVKQALRRVEYRFNLRAFIGAGIVQSHPVAPPFGRDPAQREIAPEIRASGRMEDINALLRRLENPQNQVIVIHGPSGVGKSSILSAGLVPALYSLQPGDRVKTVPILIQSYDRWQAKILTALQEALSPWLAAAADRDQPEPEDVRSLLRFGVEKSQFFVLLFDQFEEFFFDEPDLDERRSFYTFLQHCIDQPWVKVVLALREDYLHHLIEAERIGNEVSRLGDLDLLSRSVRYPLGNFTPSAAATVIETLTTNAQYFLEPALIQRLVTDLAAATGSVQPIELQIVGAQLQRNEISTLAQYEALGPSPKEKLAQQFLTAVVRDCGPPHEKLAWLVLYLLTDIDRNRQPVRPSKTREELEYELLLLGFPAEPQPLNLVLSILVGSGLVFYIPQQPEDRYQLVHDYLVPDVREVQAPDLIAELDGARAEAKAIAQSQHRGQAGHRRPTLLVQGGAALAAIGRALERRFKQ